MEFSDKEILGFGGALVSFLGGFWLSAKTAGKKEAAIVAKDKAVAKEIELLSATVLENTEKIAELEEDIAEVRKNHIEGLGDIRAFFQTPAGGQKFMTFPDHDLICLRNSKVLLTEMQHLTKAVQGLTEQSAESGKQLSQMVVDIAVVKAEMKKT